MRVCELNESENCLRVESCSTGVVLRQKACVVICGVSSCETDDMGAMGDVRLDCFFLRCAQVHDFFATATRAAVCMGRKEGLPLNT